MAHPPQEHSQRQVQRILHSATFRNAHTLQQLLQFLVAQAYGPDGEKLKEYTIGLGAFGRPQDFDPKTDPIVRVQTHRLRQKLKEYYDSEGERDPILIEIPKGHYLPIFEEISAALRINGHPPFPVTEISSPDDVPIAQRGPEAQGQSTHSKPGSLRSLFSRRHLFMIAAAAAILILGMLIGSEAPRIGSGKASVSASTGLSYNPATEPVKTLWTGLLGNDPTPIIAHADAVFLLDSHNDLFAFPYGATEYRGALVNPNVAQQFAADPTLAAKAGKLYYEDAYLGAGDLDGVAILSNLFGQMGLKPIVEPGRELTPADFEQHNVILVGSSFQSFAESQFNTVGDFSFVNPNPRMGDWNGIIVNAHPRPGEQSIYRTERDPVTQVLKTDYAIITVQPGVVPGRYISDFGGLDTTGTEGAVKFVTSNVGVEELRKALAAQGIRSVNGDLPMFQALLSVRLEKGNEVLGTSLLTVHPLFHSEKSTAHESGSKSSHSR